MAARNVEENIAERLSYNKHNLKKARNNADFIGYAYFFIQNSSKGGIDVNRGNFHL